MKKAKAIMFDPALTQLMHTLMRAGFRRAFRQVLTPLGACLAVVVLFFVVAGLGPSVVMGIFGRGTNGSEVIGSLRKLIPVLMYLAAAMAISADAGKAMLELRPPELQFVLAGPFTDRQILSYRLLTMALGWIPMSLFFSFFALPYVGSFLGGVLGIMLGSAFLVLITMMRALATPRLSALGIQGIRLFAIGGAALMGLEVAWRSLVSSQAYSIKMVEQVVQGAWSVQVLTLPFRPFTNLFSGQMNGMLIANGAISCGLVVLAALGCYQLNVGFAELAGEGVARRMKKLERIKSGNINSYGLRPKSPKRSLPLFPWWHGIGPIAWLQTTISLRRSGRLVPGLVAIGAVLAVVAVLVLQRRPDLMSESQREFAVPVAMGIASYIGFLIVIVSQAGFGAPKRTLTWFQTLPSHPLALAIGMFIGSFIVLAGIRTATFLPSVAISTQSLLECLSIFFAGLAVDLGFVSTIGFVSAATSLRPTPEGTPDVLQGARAMLFMFVVSIGMIPTLIAGAIGAAVAGLAFGFDWAPCAIGAGVGAAMIQPLVWYASGEIFSRRELETA